MIRYGTVSARHVRIKQNSRFVIRQNRSKNMKKGVKKGLDTRIDPMHTIVKTDDLDQQISYGQLVIY